MTEANRDMTGTDPLGLVPPVRHYAPRPTGERAHGPFWCVPPRGRRYVIHPLPICTVQAAIPRRQRPRMGLRFAVG